MINKEEIFVNENHWRNMSENELNDFAKKIFDYYRENGFPYYSTDNKIRQKEFKKLEGSDYTAICLFDDIIKQTMHGLGLAWSYFPHAFNVPCNNMMTPYEAFMDDEIFLKVIHKRLKIGTYMSDSGIRKMLKIYTGVQAVSNFRPTAAAWIYYKFARKGVVWDMSGGWGGRLLGAIIGNVDTYIATEPCHETRLGLQALAQDFAEKKIWYDIVECGSEIFRPQKNSLDLCFTSPPYFNLEKYSNESTQSYVKFNDKEAWVEGFLKPTFENCHYGLKPDKYMLINIADPKGKNNINLEEETIRIAKNIGFAHEKTYRLALSNVNMRGKHVQFKYEPIFLFRKR